MDIRIVCGISQEIQECIVCLHYIESEIKKENYFKKKRIKFFEKKNAKILTADQDAVNRESTENLLYLQ